MWTPRVLIVNDRGLKYHLPRIAEVDDDGNVMVRQRVSGKLSSDLAFREFPFDTQLLPVEIISYQYSPEEVVFSTDSMVTGVEKFAVEGWNLKILEPSFDLFEVPAASATRPQLTVLLEAERLTKYYLLTMFLPMSLIVFMSWTVFWLQPDIVPSRIAISTASIFSLIAFGFSIRLSLPKVSYMTRADLFVMGCTLLVFLALAVAAISSRWVNSDRMERALRANVFMRWTYVLLYALVIVVALTV
jgi:gamma-aminobutyric acid receptor subunit beta